MADRPIEELLQLDTYQGMTDSEIESILAYRVNAAVSTAYYQDSVNVVQNAMNSYIAAQQAQLQHSMDLLDALCANPPVLETVVHDE